MPTYINTMYSIHSIDVCIHCIALYYMVYHAYIYIYHGTTFYNVMLYSTAQHIITLMYSIGPGGFACATRGGVAMRSWPLLLPTFSLSLFFLRLLLLTHFGKTPVCENLFPPKRKKERNTPGTAGCPCGRDRKLAVKICFFRKKKN